MALWLLIAFLYHLFMLLCGQIALPFQANGSLITNNQGKVIGAVLIAQPFKGLPNKKIINRFAKQRKQREKNTIMSSLRKPDNLISGSL